MNKKRYFVTIFIISMISLAIVGLIKVNIINTKALSPLGTTKNNYEMVKEEFGEDFSNFIKDNSAIKIYTDDADEALVRINDKDFKIKDESSLVKGIKDIFGGIFNFFGGIKDGIDNFTNKLNEK